MKKNIALSYIIAELFVIQIFDECCNALLFIVALFSYGCTIACINAITYKQE